MSFQPPYDVFAVSAPGVETLTRDELAALGAHPLETVSGGVTFRAGRQLLYTANLHLRSASRLLVRVARFRAVTFAELERHARDVPWDVILPPGTPVRLRVTCRKSRLYHSDAVAERIAGALVARAGAVVEETPGAADAPDDGAGPSPAQLLVVRFEHDRCTISADSSGEHLHQRGYRRAVTQAPIRETLAASLLLASGWNGSMPLLDPFCGSGTIPIEAALVARRRAPGLGRWFRFEAWPDFDARTWDRVVARARAEERQEVPVPIIGSDRSTRAIQAAGENARRAGVHGDVSFVRRDIAVLEPPGDTPGWIVTNPPYGVRLGHAAGLRALYDAFGRVVRDRFMDWQVGVLGSDARLTARLRLKLVDRLKTTNGGIPVRYATGVVMRPAPRRRP